MAGLFAGVDLFGSGPHRFELAAQGQAEIPPGETFSQQVQPSSTWTQLGLMGVSVRVRGRLVAASESGLWQLRDAIAGMLTSPPTSGLLTDGLGRQWSGMRLVGYVERGPVARGRVWSVGYEAVFRDGGQA